MISLTQFKFTGKNKIEVKLRRMIRPVEQCLELIPAVIIRDTAIDALCHGAQLALPGILAVPKVLKMHELVGIYTLKGEVVGLAEAAMSIQDIKDSVKGIAFHVRRIIMKPGTYPRAWRSNVDNKDTYVRNTTIS